MNVQYLWVQERVREADFAVQKIDGEVNPADLMTKNLDETKMWRHLVKLDYFQLGGRATSAPTMQAMLAMLDGSGCVHGGAGGQWFGGHGARLGSSVLGNAFASFRLAAGTDVVIRQGD